MANIGDTVTQPIPAVGTAGTAYATQINSFLGEVKARLEARIPMSSLLLGTLDMQNGAILNAAYLGLTSAAAAPTSPVGSFHSYGGNAYFVGSAGAVQITNGANLNIAATGGITGDYGGVNPAQFRFVDADQTYYAYDNFAGSALGYVRGLGMEIAPSAASSNRLRLAWGGAVNYTLTFPPASVGSATFLQMNGGAVTASNSMGSNITLTGSADLKHGDRVRNVEFFGNIARVVSGGVSTGGATNAGCIVNASSVVKFPIPGIVDGDRIKSISVIHGGSAASVAFALNSNSGTSFTAIATTTNTLTSPATVTIAAPAAASGLLYYMSVSTGAATCAVYRMAITYDRP